MVRWGSFRGIAFVLAIVTAGALGAVVSPFASPRAEAIDGSEFDAGHIISDRNFYDGAAMSEAEIQQFLQAKVGSCANSNCLANYRADTPTRTWSFGTCSTYHGGTAESAARIIFKVQQACGLSAKVILVTLQKEQTLVTSRAPSDGVMRKAMGYGCPDTSVCDSTYYGFFNQVFAAGRQLTWYSNPAGSFTSIRIGQANSIRYSPDAACGSKSVVVQNKATAALYYYTPYTPNAAALANLNGLGDSCSAYGNRNFWVFYNQWFGPPAGGSNPIGVIESRSGGIGGITISGWALDRDTSDPIGVHVYVDGVGTALTANQPRPDVGAAYGLGSNHGFAATLPVRSSGEHSVCVYAINLLGGATTVLDCFTIQARGGAVVGAFESAIGSGGQISVSGWALDPDTTNATSVHVYVNNTGTVVASNAQRADVGAAFPGYGSGHGFAATVSAPPGANNVCVYAIDIAGIGTSPVSLGCRTVTIMGEQGREPFGRLESVRGVAGGIELGGWALDPDTAASIAVHVYVDDRSAAYLADKPRPDIAAAYPAWGDRHGFGEVVVASPGSHRVCVYAINTGAGVHPLLGCQTVVVPGIVEQGRAPIGSLEAVGADAAGIRFSGWALDPDSAHSIAIHAYVDGVGVAYTADKQRADVGAAYSGYGDAHGFSEALVAGPGAHTLCVYAINSAAGAHTLLGCRSVTVSGLVDTGRAPIGNFEAAVVRAGGMDVYGWALDPDTTGPIAVHAYVDGVGLIGSASLDRADVGAAYPAYGPSHGIALPITAGTGPHRVCLYAINNGAGANTFLGCRDVTVP